MRSDARYLVQTGELDQIAREMKLAYTAPQAATARAEFEKFTDTWGVR